VTGVGFKPGEKRSFREPEGMWGNLMGVKVKNGDARRLRVYSITDGTSSSSKTRRVTSQGKSYNIPIPAGRAGKAINFALDQLGDRYVWAAHGPNAWDCSGLTGGAWIHAGVRVPQQSDAQRATLRHVPTSQMRPGDILWHPGHVQLYLGKVNGKRTVVEAANPRVPVRIDQTGWMDIKAVLRP
jgi:cell wall-associated NlpC family hydrolase